MLLQNLSAQKVEWFGKGAFWEHGNDGLGGYGKSKTYATGKTMLGSKECTILESVNYFSGFPPTNNLDTTYGKTYAYAQNDSVFEWQNGIFKLVYDFTLNCHFFNF